MQSEMVLADQVLISGGRFRDLLTFGHSGQGVGIRPQGR